jgi:16S rRNA C1402 (ribose-2'-O) methylase RsmI
VGIARELTKAHEELVVSPISEMSQRLKEARGEFTVLVLPRLHDPDALRSPPDIDRVRLEIGQMIESGQSSKRQAVKVLAERYGIGANELYRMLEGSHIQGHKT